MSKKKKDFVLFPIVRLKIRLHPLGILGAICFSPSESSEPPGVACPKNRLTCFPNENEVLQAAPPQQKGPAWSEIEDSISSLGTCQSKMPWQMTLLLLLLHQLSLYHLQSTFPHRTHSMITSTWRWQWCLNDSLLHLVLPCSTITFSVRPTLTTLWKLSYSAPCFKIFFSFMQQPWECTLQTSISRQWSRSSTVLIWNPSLH